MANVNEGPTQSLNDGGYITVWKNVGGTFGWYKIPVADVAVVKTLAETALQSDGVTDIVTEDPEAYLRVAAAQSQFAALQAQVALQAVQITNLEALIGAGLIHVLEDGIVEAGVVS